MSVSNRRAARSALRAIAVALLLMPLFVPSPILAQGVEPATARIAAELRAQALDPETSEAYAFVRDLTIEVGPRLAGSDGDRRGVAWSLVRLKELGFDNVRAEPVTVPVWRRGGMIAEVTAPHVQPMVAVALGGSVGTKNVGIEAPVLRVESLAALDALPADAARGQIVYIDERMERTRSGAGYSAAVMKRVIGASSAAAKGAVALLIRSVGTSNNRIAHTGTMRYRPDTPRIPAAALSNPDADQLTGLLARGPVTFRLGMGSGFHGEAESANVLAEVTGGAQADEIVLLACHLDSWDLGTGALDDGVGCAIVVEAARLIGRLAAAQPEARPRRTIRVFLAANEEFGLSGARAYGLVYDASLDKHVAAMESDFGGGAVYAMSSDFDRNDPAVGPLIDDLLALLAPLGITYEDREPYGGADINWLRPRAGVPLLDLSQDGTDYFDLHHTVNDVLAQVDPDDLRQNVAAHAVVAYVLANHPRALPRLTPVADED
ncbi:MAG: M28 family peptidase [Acidobacteriota bacterium]